jgi:hypothetical protein
MANPKNHAYLFFNNQYSLDIVQSSIDDLVGLIFPQNDFKALLFENGDFGKIFDERLLDLIRKTFATLSANLGRETALDELIKKSALGETGRPRVSDLKYGLLVASDKYQGRDIAKSLNILMHRSDETHLFDRDEVIEKAIFYLDPRGDYKSYFESNKS